MKTEKIIILSFVVLSAIITGCKPPVDTHAKDMEQIQQLQEKLTETQQTLTNAEQKHPANLVGKWKAEFTMKIPLVIKNEREEIISRTREKIVDDTIEINLESSGSANLEGDQDGQAQETISGSWKQIDDFLIIERPNAGFAAFHISSQSTNQLTVFSRTGETLQFNRIP